MIQFMHGLIFSLLFHLTVQKIIYEEILSSQKDSKGIASIRIRANDEPPGYGHICSGAFITLEAVIAPAECFYQSNVTFQPEDILVVGGILNRMSKMNGTKFDVKSIHIHPKYNRKEYSSNVGILILTTKIPKTSKISTISLFEGTMNGKTPAYTIGYMHPKWGRPLTDEMITTRLIVYSEENCRKKIDADLGVICAGDHIRNTKQQFEQTKLKYFLADTGGILLVDNSLAGLFLRAIRDLGSDQFIGLFTDIHTHRYWIRKIIFDETTKIMNLSKTPLTSDIRKSRNVFEFLQGNEQSTSTEVTKTTPKCNSSESPPHLKFYFLLFVNFIVGYIFAVL